MWKQRYDKIWAGIIAGLVVPTLFIYLFSLALHSESNLGNVLYHYYSVGKISSLLSLSLLCNLAVFFILYRMKLEMAPRGVILATLIWGIAIIYFKML